MLYIMIIYRVSLKYLIFIGRTLTKAHIWGFGLWILPISREMECPFRSFFFPFSFFLVDHFKYYTLFNILSILYLSHFKIISSFFLIPNYYIFKSLNNNILKLFDGIFLTNLLEHLWQWYSELLCHIILILMLALFFILDYYNLKFIKLT